MVSEGLSTHPEGHNGFHMASKLYQMAAKKMKQGYLEEQSGTQGQRSASHRRMDRTNSRDKQDRRNGGEGTVLGISGIFTDIKWVETIRSLR